MAEKRFKRIVRPATAEERERHATIRQMIVQEFPPAEVLDARHHPPESRPKFARPGNPVA